VTVDARTCKYDDGDRRDRSGFATTLGR